MALDKTHSGRKNKTKQKKTQNRTTTTTTKNRTEKERGMEKEEKLANEAVRERQNKRAL